MIAKIKNKILIEWPLKHLQIMSSFQIPYIV